MGLMRQVVLVSLAATAMLADYSWALPLVLILAVAYVLTMRMRFGATGEICRSSQTLSQDSRDSMGHGGQKLAPSPD